MSIQSRRTHQQVHWTREEKVNHLIKNPKVLVEFIEALCFKNVMIPLDAPFSNIKTLQLATEEEKNIPLLEKCHHLYIKIQEQIQEATDLQFAFLDGKHRAVTAIHLFGGYPITPSVKKVENSEMLHYKLSLNIKISGDCSI